MVRGAIRDSARQRERERERERAPTLRAIFDGCQNHFIGRAKVELARKGLHLKLRLMFSKYPPLSRVVFLIRNILTIDQIGPMIEVRDYLFARDTLYLSISSPDSKVSTQTI